MGGVPAMSCRVPTVGDLGREGGFPSFLPREVESIRDPAAREMARRIQRVPVKMGSSKFPIMTSCVKPVHQRDRNPVVLLHGFDSSCLEWTYSYPLLEDAGLETWAIDILGWGFSDLRARPSCDVASKREHLYQLWRAYIRRPMVLVGPSLGAAVSIDFAVNFPEAVSKLVLIGPSVYSKGVGQLSKLPRVVAYAGVRVYACSAMVSLLKSLPLRLYASSLAFKELSLGSTIDWTNVSRLHCLQPWWEDAMVEFMISGGYNVLSKIRKVRQKTVIIWGEEDKLVNSNLAQRLQGDIRDSILYRIPNCGHLPHIEKAGLVAGSIAEFARQDLDIQEKLIVTA